MPAAQCEYFDTAGLEACRDFFDQLVQQGGPEPRDYRAFQSCLDRLAKTLRCGLATPGEIQALWATGGVAIASRRTMQGFVRARPHGYPGDFELVDRIYQTWISPEPALEKWDRFFQAQTAPRALRNSKAYFQVWLRQIESRRPPGPSPLRLLHLGGSGRELRDYFLAHPDSGVAATYLDPDAQAIVYAAGVCLPVRTRVTFHQANPLGFHLEQAPHVIWAAGQLDYLDDENGIGLLRRLWRLLPSGGELAAANFAPHNPTRAYMELNRWSLNYRAADDLANLAREAGVPDASIQVGQEPEGVNLFLHLRRPDFTPALRA